MDIRAQKTIRRFAEAHGVSERDVFKAAQRALDVPKARSRDRDHPLDGARQRALERAMGQPPRIAVAGSSEPPSAEAPALEAEVLPPPPVDPRAAFEDATFGSLDHGVWVHTDVFERVEPCHRERKRLSLVLQHFGAHGHTAFEGAETTRTAAGDARRSVATVASSTVRSGPARADRPVKSLALPTGGIVVRAVRHHDDHRPLLARFGRG